MKVFPEGFLCATVDGKVYGFVCSEIVSYDLERDAFSWYDITDSGFIKNTHNSQGNVLYGVSLSVLSYSEANIATRLLEAIGKLAVQKGLKYAILGSRMPSYYKYCKDYSPEEYIKAKNRLGRFIDPELALYQKVGLQPIKILPDYFEDPKSLNYGVLVVWENPFKD